MANMTKELSDSHTIGRIAAHVPNMVVYSSLYKKPPYTEEFFGVLLFVDVSGFTALTEKFNLSNKRGYGADDLTRILNSYIGQIVNHILAAGGDILNYAGDAILAVWAAESMQLSDVISVVVQCSLVIQQQHGFQDTGIGCKLCVKIGISAGKLSKIIVGDETNQYYAVIGPAVDEVRLAESLATAGDIILSPNTWKYCNRDHIAIEHIQKEKAVKVRFLKRPPSFSVEKYVEEMGKNLEHEDLEKGCLRKAFRLMPDDERENYMQKYVMNGVLQKIDDQQPLEFLSEIRPATTVFVNLQFSGTKSEQEQCVDIQKATDCIIRQMLHHHGRLSKVFMFDKGCTFLCVFGLPGDKRVDESAHALWAGYSIYEDCLQKISCLRIVSVGVTSGPIFCGVVGHDLRHEYTVIGSKVNLAARLMMYYPGLVSCDSETYSNSRFSPSYFINLPKKSLKGMQDPGPIYQFTGRRHQTYVGRAPMSVEWRADLPLLGRDKETHVYTISLMNFLEVWGCGGKRNNNVIIYEGAFGYGKSHLLAEIIHISCKEDVRVMTLELTRSDVDVSLYTLQTMLAQLLCIQDCRGHQEKQEAILTKVQEPELRENLCLLNDLLLVQFVPSNSVSAMDTQTRNMVMRKYVLQLFWMLAKEEPCVFVMDQAHFVDQASWSFLLEACESTPLLLVMALLPHADHSTRFPELTHLISSPHTLCLQLPPLTPPVIAKITCQTLGVVAIPCELEMFLVERSEGVPFYCKKLLQALDNMLKLEVLDVEKECEDIGLLFPELLARRCSVSLEKRAEPGKEDCRRSARVLQGSAMSKKRSDPDMSSPDGPFVCVVEEAANFHSVPVPLVLKGVALAQLDQMQPAEQMLVKCAAIIGRTFSTRMLMCVVSHVSVQKLNTLLVSLFSSGTLECASRPRNLSPLMSREAQRCGLLRCYCSREQHHGQAGRVRLASVSGVWECRLMRFCSCLVHQTVCELWLTHQKRALHHKCALYLQHQRYRCWECGADEFVFGHKAAVGGIESHGYDDLSCCADVSCDITLQGTLSTKLSSLVLCRGIRSNQVQPSEETWETFLAKVDSLVHQWTSRDKGRSSTCKCAHLVESVLLPLVRHWMDIKHVTRCLYYLLEAAAACLHLSNTFRALSFLNEAKVIVDNLSSGQPAFDGSDSNAKVRICKFEKALLFRLRGEILFKNGQILEAEENFVKALRNLSRRFPRNVIGQTVMNIVEKIKRCFSELRKSDVTELKKLAVLYEQVNCLSHLWQISCMRRLPRSASLAIAMETNSSMHSADALKVLFSTIEYFQYTQMAGRDGESRRYEQQLWKMCVAALHCVQAPMLIGRFTRVAAIVKLRAGNVEQSVQYALRAQRLCRVLGGPGLDMWTIVALQIPLLLTTRYRECVQLIQGLELLDNNMNNRVAKGWFCAACLDFLLYAGIVLQPFKECLCLVEEAESDPDLVANKSLMMNLYSAVALWYARQADWEKVPFFYSKAYALYGEVPPSVSSIRGVVMFLECSILLFRKSLTERSANMRTVFNKIQERFSDFSHRFVTLHNFLPRLLHLKAFLLQLIGHDSQAMGMATHALRLCEKQGNMLDRNWIRESQVAWFRTSKFPEHPQNIHNITTATHDPL